MNLYAKIYCEEGVIIEKKFETEKEAEAFVEGYKSCIEALDITDDFHDVGVDSAPSVEEYTNSHYPNPKGCS